MRQRALPAFLAILSAALLLLFSQHPLFAFFVVFCLALAISVALWEFLKMSQTKGYDLPIFLSVAASFFYPFAVFYEASFDSSLPLSTAVFCAYVFATFLLSFFVSKKAILNLAISVFAFVYVVMSLSKMIELLYQSEGIVLVVYLILTTKICDTAAFFAGYFFGRTKIFPNLSPKKTLEGVIAGFLAPMLLSFLFVFFLPLSLARLLLLSFLMAFFAQVGDLAESLLKRDAQIKDSNQIPGLGGVLDIFDSLIFTSPFLSIIYSSGFIYDHYH